LPLPTVGEADLRSRPSAGATVSSLRKQESRLLWVCPLVPFPRKRQSSTPLPTAGEAGGAQGTAG